MLRKINKKLILLCSPEAPFWKGYLTKVSQNKIAEVLEIAVQTMKNWEQGRGVDERTLDKMFIVAKHNLTEAKPEQTQEETEEQLSSIKDDLQDDSVSVYEFATRLGFSMRKSQMVIDQKIYEQMPVFRDIYYENNSRQAERADQDIKTFGGVYSVYIERGEDTIHAVLRVRYILELKGLKAIRAKFNVPKYVPVIGKERPYFEYDGFLSVKANNIFWMFEERDSKMADFFHFITERADVQADTSVFKGHYLSTERSPGSPILNGRIFMVKEDIEEDGHHDFMHSQGEILKDQSYEELLKKHAGE